MCPEIGAFNSVWLLFKLNWSIRETDARTDFGGGTVYTFWTSSTCKWKNMCKTTNTIGAFLMILYQWNSDYAYRIYHKLNTETSLPLFSHYDFWRWHTCWFVPLLGRAWAQRKSRTTAQKVSIFSGIPKLIRQIITFTRDQGLMYDCRHRNLNVQSWPLYSAHATTKQTSLQTATLL